MPNFGIKNFWNNYIFSSGVLQKSDKVVAVARVGSPSQRIASCTLEELVGLDMGDPLHSLVICGHMHPLEEEYLNAFSLCS